MTDGVTDQYQRSVFYLSDGTGITAETFGSALLSQFEGIALRPLRLPFVDSPEKAAQAVERIDAQAMRDGMRPIVFSTLVNVEIIDIVRRANCRFLDLFQSFLAPLEEEFGASSSHRIGRSHTATDNKRYDRRIAAINFSLAHDDGQSDRDLAQADIILIGVSRSGKTPTSLYLAMQHGVKAANYPLIPEDFERRRLPEALTRVRSRLFGLSIAPERLSEVRHERRPNSHYASLQNCRSEVAAAEAMMRREGISWLSSTTKSIEEIAATVLQKLEQDPQ
ncbi:MAG: pyruvate, water dikinase regulatory protein [Burkholderiaceae bacterium]